MTRHGRVVAVYWIALIAGLVFYTAIRSADPASVIPLWIGVLGGTALGHVLAVHGFPFWIALVITLGIAANLMLVPFAPMLLVLAFVPATWCGYWSLSDRGGLVAFWFPCVVWMLSILDRTGPRAAPDGAGIGLLGALAVAFIAFLRVRESRRADLWRTFAAVPLAHEETRAIRKEPPAAQLSRAAWLIVVSAIAFAVTAWIAPSLWRSEKLAGDAVAIAEPGELPCCQPMYDDPPRERIKEYFDLGRGFDEPAARRRHDCRICPAPEAVGGGAITTWEPGGLEPSGVVHEPGGGVPDGVAPFSGSTASPTATPGAQTTPAPPVTAAAPPVAGLPTPPQQNAIEPPPARVDWSRPTPPPLVTPPPAPAPAPPQVTPSPMPAHAAHRPAPIERADGSGLALLHWIAVLVAGALIFQLVNLGLRPLRRLIVLRHLRRPFWDETVDQRASNSWQLALIGLRDAGWRATSSEAPREFASRAGVDGLERCATILERVRHGVRLDAGDLDEMGRLASAAYVSARSRAGRFARAMSWLRWPLT